MRVCVCVREGGSEAAFAVFEKISFFIPIFAEMLFFFVAPFCTKKGKKKLLAAHLPETAKETRKESKKC